MFKEMRRKDRELSKNKTNEIVKNGNYGILSLVCDNEYPYGVPLHYVFIDNYIYFHSSLQGGLKSECFNHCPKASFTIVESEDGIKAESAIIFGIIECVPKMKAMVLEKLIEKFVPPFAWEQAKVAIPFAENDIMTYRLKIEHLTGKAVDKPEG